MSAVGRQVLRLGGYAPALPTPFDDVGELDLSALERLCHRQIEEGATALVVCGTTGEAPTLSRAEHDTIVRVTERPSVPSFFRRTSREVCEAITALDDPKRAAILKAHLARIDDLRLRRAFHAAVTR